MTARLGRNASWMLAASATMNLCMLAYHRLMSQRLGDAYGELASLTALINVLGVLSLGASATFVKAFAEDAAEGGPAAVKGRLLALLGPLARVLLMAALVLAAAATPVARYLALDGFGPYALAGATLLLGLATLMARAALQGADLFGGLGLSVAAEGLSALGLAAVFTRFSAGPSGALAGIACGQLAALTVCAALFLSLGPAAAPSPRDPAAKEMAADAAALGLFTLIAYLDLFAIKHRVDAGAAAGYARAALVAKSLLFVTAALNAVLLPAASAARARGDIGRARELLVQCLALALFLECAALTTIGRFTGLIVRVLCGPDASFLALVPLIRAYAAAVVPLALVQPVLYALLAARDYRVLWLLAATAAGYAALLRAAGGDPFRTILSLAAASVILLGGTLILAWREKTQ